MGHYWRLSYLSKPPYPPAIIGLVEHVGVKIALISFRCDVMSCPNWRVLVELMAKKFRTRLSGSIYSISKIFALLCWEIFWPLDWMIFFYVINLTAGKSLDTEAQSFWHQGSCLKAICFTYEPNYSYILWSLVHTVSQIHINGCTIWLSVSQIHVYSDEA